MCTWNEDLIALCKKYPVAIPVRQAAKHLGVSEEGLRAAMDQNRCPFGFSWKLGTRSGYKISSQALANWLTKGNLPFDW